MVVSDLIALLALGVAFVSVFIARKSGVVSNRIALHEPRKEIYDGLLWYRGLFLGMDCHPTDEEIDIFYRRAVAPSEIYLSPDLSHKIHDIYKRSWDAYRYIELAENGDIEESKWDYIIPFQEIGRTELEEVISEVSACIHVGGT